MYKKSYSRFRKPTKSYRRKPLVKKAIAKVRNASFKKKVLKVIHSQNETKEAFLSVAYSDYNSFISGTADVNRVIPNIANGNGDNQRIGDQIRPQKLKWDAIVQFPPIVSTTLHNQPGLARIAVRLMLVTPKSYPNWATASSVDWTQNLLKKGGTVSGFNGTVADLYAPINTDAITCHYNKVMYFNQPYVLHNGSTTDVPITTAGLTRHVSKTFNFKNAVFKYDANIDSGLTPTNKGIFAILGYCYTDGSTSPDSITTRVRMQYTSRLTFEDA